MSDQLNQLAVVLMALLPKDGTPISVADLVSATCSSVELVTQALEPAGEAGSVQYDPIYITYRAVKRGDALPTTNPNA